MTQRQDAQRNRELLLAAGEEVFREHGLHVPLQLIAERAGVGRGTLYRHFPDRDHLARAMIERRVELIEQRLASAPDPARSVEEIFFWIADTLSAIPGLHPYLASTEAGRTTLDQLNQRLRGLLAGPVRAARARGLLRPGVTLDDFVYSWAMIEGSMLAVPPQERSRMVARAKALLGSALFERSAVS
ncbi:TetR/AcrR family transcriptional regulator [Archangium violaceum]|uniref:TetR family transcriptional regulator n=1 Tax=Archangium violaceum Cb vi76 TaxID=1406225 RepID=A0A084SHT9_9BACT|nr:TetR/AcrR family transcriptional regulator [Archangium violaceum]KFA88024.1 TetR family transcriptional regulator [Archangium violaceum Cb vi76]